MNTPEVAAPHTFTTVVPVAEPNATNASAGQESDTLATELHADEAEREAQQKTKREKRRETTVVVSTGPYLPLTGALPLRFSSARKWPAPLPKTTPAAEAPTSSVAAASTPPPMTADNRALAATDAVRPMNAPATATVSTAVAGSGPRPQDTPEATMLTADMVLGFLGTLPSPDARVSVRFEPAVPQAAVARTP